MRASNHSGRITAAGKAYSVGHNDRNFISEKDKHIDKERSQDNVYFVIDNDGKVSELDTEISTLREHEIGRYGELYAASLYRKNEGAIEQRHPERVKSMEQYLDGRYTCPEEEILQVGKEGELQDLDAFKRCVLDYIAEHQRRYPDIKILDASIHADETSLHCHLRKTYPAPDKEGRLEASQHRCLERLGFTLPHPDKKRSQYNNLKVPYTESKRQLWLDICERDLGLRLERNPDKRGQRLELLDYQRQQAADKLESEEAMLRYQREQVALSQDMVRDLRSEADALRADIAAKDHKIGIGERLIERQQEAVQKNIDTIEQQKSTIETLDDTIRERELAAQQSLADFELLERERIKKRAIEENKIYQRLDPGSLQMTPEQLRGYLSDSYTETLIRDTVSATLGALEERGALKRHLHPMEEVDVRKSVLRELSDRTQHFFDKVRAHMIERVKDHMEHDER